MVAEASFLLLFSPRRLYSLEGAKLDRADVFFLQIMSLERQNAEASVSRLSKTGIMSLQLLQAHEIGSL